MLRGSARESKIYCANERLPENDNGFTKRLYTCFLHARKHGGYEYYHAICKQQNGMQSFLDPHCRGSMPIVVAAFFLLGAIRSPCGTRAHPGPCGPMRAHAEPMRAHAGPCGSARGPCGPMLGPCGPMRAHAGPCGPSQHRAPGAGVPFVAIGSRCILPRSPRGAEARQAAVAGGSTRKRRQALAVE